MPLRELEKLIAWGQYLHWAELHFTNYLTINDDSSDAEVLGIASHWLASEYVAFEGWKQLGIHDKKISLLIEKYPDHCDILRKCRNAVYHYQTKPLDSRIIRVLENKDEELSWFIVLHYEFQRFLISHPLLSYRGSISELEELAEEIEGCIGWWPKETVSARFFRLYKNCIKLVEIIGDESTLHAQSTRELVDETLNKLSNLEHNPAITIFDLKRLKGILDI